MSNLFRLIGRRLVALPVMVLGVTLLVFVVMSFSSADPARLALGESATPDALEQYRAAHHLNDPLLQRYWDYLLGLVHGDLGTSFTGVDTSQRVAEAFPITLQLTFIGIFVAVIFATILGIIAALYRDKWQETFDKISEEVPLYPIFHRKSPIAYNSSPLKDFQPIKLTGLSFVGTGSTKS